MEHLFAYGTLMCEEILCEVSGLKLASVPGVLSGYRRLAVKGECFPGLVRFQGGSVEGMVYRYVPDEAWERLDQFEGAMYVRARVHVELSAGKMIAAQTYLVRSGFLDRLDSADWDFDAFIRDLTNRSK